MQSPFAKLEAGQAPTDAEKGDWKANGILVTGQETKKDTPTVLQGKHGRMLVRGVFHLVLWIVAGFFQVVMLVNFQAEEDHADNRTRGLYDKAYDFPKTELHDVHLPLAVFSLVGLVIMVAVVLGLSAFYDLNELKKYWVGQTLLFVGTMGAAFSSAVQVYFLTMAATALKYDDATKTGEQDGDENPYFNMQLLATFTTLGALMTLYSFAGSAFELEEFVPSLAWGFALVQAVVIHSGYLEYDKNDPNGAGKPSGPTWDHIKVMAGWLWILNLIYVLVPFFSKFYVGMKADGNFFGFATSIPEVRKSGPLVRSVFFTLVVVTLTLSGLLYNFAANEWTEHSLGTSKYFSSGGRVIALVILALQFTMLKTQMDKSTTSA